MTEKTVTQETEVLVKFSLNATHLRRVLDSAANGLPLSIEDRNEILLFLSGESFFLPRTSSRTHSADEIKTQFFKLLGRELRKALVSVSEGGDMTAKEREKLKEWLYSTRRDIRRHQRWRNLFYAALILATLALGLLVARYFSPQLLQNKLLLPPLIVSIGVLIGAVIKDIYIDKNVETALDDVRSTAEHVKDEVTSILEKNLRPRITPLGSREDVLRAANEILLEAFQESRERRFVYFMGAASLSTQKDLRAAEESRLSLTEQYTSMLRNLEGAKVTVKRFIALIHPNEIRREDTLREYVVWLKKQIDLLKGNDKYELIDCKRAQPWGGSRSSIITYRAFLDIVGEAESGFIVKDEEVARTLRMSSEKLFASAKQERYSGNDSQSIEKLEKIVNEINTKL